MSNEFNALVVDKDDEGNFLIEIRNLSISDLPDENVLVDIDYSTLNYKDGLVVTDTGSICQKFPMVCGIDLAGTVAESSDPNWKVGDRVLANGYGLSERYWGAYSQKQRINGDFLVRAPDNLSNLDAMAIGTAGYTAMLCVNAIRDHGTIVSDGDILVTGSAGGVGSVAILLLSKLGYSVTASTGRPETADYLRSIGASNVIERDELSRKSRPLEKELWAACVDSVGSSTIATSLAQTKYNGIVAACGLAGGADLPSTVLPFILRNVCLQGVDSVMAPMDVRVRAWNDLGMLLDPSSLSDVYSVEPLARVPELGAAILRGEIRGRVVIDVNA